MKKVIAKMQATQETPYKRSLHCRICELPVSSSGVRVAQLDLKKFGRWWLKTFGTKFEDEAATIQSSWLCQFCVCDSRFQGEEEDADDLEGQFDWWEDENKDSFYENYYEKNIVRPCQIKVAPLKIPIKTLERMSKIKIDQHNIGAVLRVLRFIVASPKNLAESSKTARDGPDTAEALPNSIDEGHSAPDDGDSVPLIDSVFSMSRNNCQAAPAPEEEVLPQPGVKTKVSFEMVAVPCPPSAECATPEHPIKTECESVPCPEAALEEDPLLMPLPQQPLAEKEVNPRKRGKNNKPTPTDCVHCGENFSSKMEAFKHVPAAHKNLESFCCFKCYVHFKSAPEKMKHQADFHSKVYQCHFCSANFGLVIGVRAHVPRHRQKDRYCCGKTFDSQKELIQHMVSSKKVTCTDCKTKVLPTEIRKHFLEVHSGEPIWCKKYCGEYFVSNEKMQSHIQNVHEESEMAQCIYCPLKVKQQNLSTHVGLVHASVEIKCNRENCDSYFLSERGLEEHTANVHLSPKKKKSRKSPPLSAPEKIKCEVGGCDQYFNSQADFEQHWLENHRVQSTDQTFKCQECDFTTNFANILQLHVHFNHVIGNNGCDKCLSGSSELKVCEHCKTFVNGLCCHQQAFLCDSCGVSSPCRMLTSVHLASCMDFRNMQK